MTSQTQQRNLSCSTATDSRSGTFGRPELSAQLHHSFLLLKQGAMLRLVLTLSLLYAGCEGQVTCRDENNDQKDWYILYKAPKTVPGDGVKYLYIDSTGATTANKAINDADGILANTLRPIFKPDGSMASNFGFISYNDQHSKCSTGTLYDGTLNATIDTHGGQNVGHTKGVVMVENGSTGVWLSHSTPQFPNKRDQNNFWPSTGSANGQTFMCVTFDYDQFDEIGLHLQYIGACPFDKKIPSDFHQSLIDAANGATKTPKTDFVTLKSSGNQIFKGIAKNMDANGQAAGGDLYVTITERFQSDVSAQTWGRQVHRDKSFCESGKRKVLNIEDVNTALGAWKASHDHSKWCVATDQNRPLTCIADVNRGKTQYVRRGGALCIEDQTVRDTFQGFVGKVEKCNTFMAIIYNMAQLSLDFVKLLVEPFFA
ncbi:plancitoxin-1-like isoform 2-T2 [Odontesthes bonariensis]|uniref:plancitoxin-1-like isoform X2 n=1 Tax=Odontesthes bonariensis TaxID=219752 RepID=UPI003F583538